MSRSTMVQNINNLMANKGYSQSDLAYRIGVSQPTISRLLRINESDKQDPFSHLVNIAKLFSVSTDYILGLTDQPNGYFHNDLEIDKDLKEKLDKISEQERNKKRPLSSPKVQNVMISLKRRGISNKEIKNFIKSEFDIEVSIEAVRNKLNSIMKD